MHNNTIKKLTLVLYIILKIVLGGNSDKSMRCNNTDTRVELE